MLPKLFAMNNDLHSPASRTDEAYLHAKAKGKTPVEYLLDLYHGDCDCTTCRTTGEITVGQLKALQPRLLAGSTKDIETTDKAMCPDCLGTGQVLLRPRDRADILKDLLPYLYPKLAAAQLDVKVKELPRVTRLSELNEVVKIVEKGQALLEAEKADSVIDEQ